MVYFWKYQTISERSKCIFIPYDTFLNLFICKEMTIHSLGIYIVNCCMVCFGHILYKQ